MTQFWMVGQLERGNRRMKNNNYDIANGSEYDSTNPTIFFFNNKRAKKLFKLFFLVIVVIFRNSLNKGEYLLSSDFI